jgi:hypothetical protein
MARVLYFAHCTSTYGTPIEGAAIATIVTWFPGAIIENPNQPKHDEGYARKGMDHFYDDVLPACDGCIVMPFLDGRYPCGAAHEARWFIQHHLPVWTLVRVEQGSTFTVHGLRSYEQQAFLTDDPRLVLSKEETRLRTWRIYKKEVRPYDQAHLVSLPLPDGFYPDEKK